MTDMSLWLLAIHAGRDKQILLECLFVCLFVDSFTDSFSTAFII